MYDASLQSLESGIAQSAPQLAAKLTQQMDVVKGRMNELYEAGGETKLAGSQGESVSDGVIGDAVSTLLKLPTDVQAKAGVEEASQAVYDYLTASEGNKAAAYDKAVQLIKESVSAATTTDGLDTGTMQKLEGLMEEIDSKVSVGDNGEGISNGISRQVEAAGIIKDEVPACVEFIKRSNGQFKDNETAIKAFKHLSNGEFNEFAEMVDVTSPFGKATFWSGDYKAAEDYANSIDGVTLEMTPGGSLLNGWDWMEKKYPIWEDRRRVWIALSKIYARNVTGPVYVIQKNGIGGYVWSNFEYPILDMRKIKINYIEVGIK